MEFLHAFFITLLLTLRDVLPIAAIIFGFQFLVIRRPIPNLKKVLLGFVYVVLGLALFLQGLEQALFPLGKLMAEQLTRPEFLAGGPLAEGQQLSWRDYYWVYIFAATLGFSTAIAEPSLLAVALKASQVSGGAISVRGLRVAVALGAGIGIALGTYRIVTGTPLHYYILAGYVLVLLQTFYAPRTIIPLAYDSGGVTTSTVTVPLVAALGLGLATHVPGRSALLDGFGMIALTCLVPIMSVLGYAQLAEWRRAWRKKRDAEKFARDNL